MARKAGSVKHKSGVNKKTVHQANPVSSEKTKTGKDFPIVGVSASAGGLEAIESFFGNMRSWFCWR